MAKSRYKKRRFTHLTEMTGDSIVKAIRKTFTVITY